MKAKASNISFDRIACAILVVAAFIGIYYRFKGIGRWPFTDDEFYLAQSVKNILKYRLPAFEGGGYYARGLLYQYIAAGILPFINNQELCLRAISAVSNIAAVPALLWLGNKIGGKIVACAAGTLFFLSVWEVEFARFARMYTMFQAIFLWYLVALYKVTIERDKKHTKWMYILSAVAPFIYEGAIFLCIMNFIPIIYSKRVRLTFGDLWIPATILAFTVAFLAIDFRRFGVDQYLPMEIAKSGMAKKSIIIIPTIMLPLIFESPLWVFVFFIILSSNLCLGYKIHTFVSDWILKVGSFLILIASSLHLFGVVIGCGLLLTCLYYQKKTEINQRYVLAISAGIGLPLIYWCLFGFTSFWHQCFPDISDPGVSNYLMLLFGFPDVYTNLIYQWLKVMPWQSIVLGLVSSAATIYVIFISERKNYGFIFIVSITVVICLLIGILNTKYHNTRYSFFIYPVMVLIGTASIMVLVRAFIEDEVWAILIYSFAVIVYFGIGEDYNFKHLYRVDSIEINFRKNLNKAKTNHYYNRYDYRTPADIINPVIKKNDIIVTLVTPAAFYLKRIDYVYIGSMNQIKGQAYLNGKKEIWTNANLIYNQQQLFDIIQTSEVPVWVIAGSNKKDFKAPTWLASEMIKDKYAEYVFGRSVDEKLTVYRIIPEFLKPPS